MERLASRGFAVLPLTISAHGRHYVGLLRDISSGGMFFYSKINPYVGAEIQLVISVSAADPDLTEGFSEKVKPNEMMNEEQERGLFSSGRPRWSRKTHSDHFPFY